MQQVVIRHGEIREDDGERCRNIMLKRPDLVVFERAAEPRDPERGAEYDQQSRQQLKIPPILKQMRHDREYSAKPEKKKAEEHSAPPLFSGNYAVCKFMQERTACRPRVQGRPALTDSQSEEPQAAGAPARSKGETFPETLIRESCGRRCIRISRCSYRQSARYFFRSSGSASIPMKTPPTTERAWKPTCLPSSVSYQSQSGTRVGVSSSQV